MRQELELQDHSLSQLSASVSTLSRLGYEIKSELEQQNEALDDIENSMDENLEGMALISKQTSALVKRAGGRRWCATIVALSIVALVLFYFVIFN